jgi:hypothetical protein
MQMQLDPLACLTLPFWGSITARPPLLAAEGAAVVCSCVLLDALLWSRNHALVCLMRVDGRAVPAAVFYRVMLPPLKPVMPSRTPTRLEARLILVEGLMSNGLYLFAFARSTGLPPAELLRLSRSKGG